MPPRRDTGFVFPPEITQLIQQQNALMQVLVQNQGNNNNNNPPPPPVDHLARFLRLNPPVFSSSTGRLLQMIGSAKLEGIWPLQDAQMRKECVLPHISLMDPQHHGGRITQPHTLLTQIGRASCRERV